MTPTPDRRPAWPYGAQDTVDHPSPAGQLAALRAELTEARGLLAHAAAFRYPPALDERLLGELHTVFRDADEIPGRHALWLRWRGDGRWIITTHDPQEVWHTGTDSWQYDERNSERTEAFSAHTRFPLPEARQILARVLAAHTTEVAERLRAQLAQVRARRAQAAAPGQGTRP